MVDTEAKRKMMTTIHLLSIIIFFNLQAHKCYVVATETMQIEDVGCDVNINCKDKVHVSVILDIVRSKERLSAVAYPQPSLISTLFTTTTLQD